MKTFKHILVTTDFQEASSGALDAAVDLAMALGAQLTVLHVWEIPIYPYMDFILNSEMISSVEDRAVERLQQTLDDVRKVLPEATSKLKHGMPWSGILQAVEELAPDLLVVGTHGRQGLSHALLGSVAEKVVRLSPVPVLTVRAG